MNTSKNILKVKVCSCDGCLQGNLLNCNTEKGILYNSNFEIEDDITGDVDGKKNEAEIEENETPSNVCLDVVIGNYSHENCLEPFYICQPVKSKKAEKSLVDTKGHSVQMGDKYLECIYLERIEGDRRKVYLKLLKDVVCCQDKCSTLV